MRTRVIAFRAMYAAAAVLVLTCARPAIPTPAETASAAREPSRASPRVVFFGSSTIAGAGATAQGRRWTAIVSRRLGWTEVNRGLARSTLTNVGRKVPSAEERWREALSGEPADGVFLMYGANDVLARVPLGGAETPGTFRHAVAAVLRGIREMLPGAAIVVCAPQPSQATAADREPYDLALAEAAADAGALFVATGSAFPQERVAALSSDRLHLNDDGHAAVADFVLAHVLGTSMADVRRLIPGVASGGVAAPGLSSAPSAAGFRRH